MLLTAPVSGVIVPLSEVPDPAFAEKLVGDGIAPVAACHHLEALLPNARVELATAPGGHLGVLTGRAAAGTTWRTLDAFLDASAPATRGARRAKQRNTAA